MLVRSTQLRLSPRAPTSGFSSWPGLLTAWRLNYERKQPKCNLPRDRSRSCWASKGQWVELPQCYFCHVLLVREATGPSQIHGVREIDSISWWGREKVTLHKSKGVGWEISLQQPLKSTIYHIRIVIIFGQKLVPNLIRRRRGHAKE